MATIELKEILISARQESHRMRHYYIGVEHLFIALLDIQSGLTRNILEEQGLTPDYVGDAIRRKIGKGSQRRLWAGTPSTPRANVIIDIATDLAMEDGRTEVNERDLLTAIIEENDNMPMRIVKSLGVNITHMHRMARTRAVSRSTQQPYVTIDFGPGFDDEFTALSDEQLLILRRMFYSHTRIRVEYQLTSGYSDAFVLIVTPIRADGSEDAVVVVKIDDTDDILDEAQRYETHVKGILPPLTARLEDRPVAPEISSLAGLVYTIVNKPGQLPQDLHTGLDEMGPDRLGHWLRQQLYAQFGRTWWQQRRPFRFQIWTEYDWLLPPLLTLKFISEEETEPSDHNLRVPINRARLNKIRPGETVTLENFTVHRVQAEDKRMILVSGRGNEATKQAHKIEINHIDTDEALHFRGEVLERITGQVLALRDEILLSKVDILEPPFDLRDINIHIAAPQPYTLPNPLVAYDELLYFQINGSASKIHGDLHLGNILIGPNETAFLIDFAHAREGHTLFDWATLEVSLWLEILVPLLDNTWGDLYALLDYAIALNHHTPLPHYDQQLSLACAPLIALRDIVQANIASENYWAEYYIALALCALRAVCWETFSVGGRRMMFLISALAIAQLDNKPEGSVNGSGESTEFPS